MTQHQPTWDPVTGPWHDVTATPRERAQALVDAMTLEEKLSQLVGLWVGADASGGDVAPHQGEMSENGPTFGSAIVDGLGQLTRPFGTAPVDPVLGARSLAKAQRSIRSANRFGIPAQVHEECLAGFAAWGATAYPIPLAWGATFNPQLIEEMARRIGRAMGSVGIHQGLAPVLDVVRDYRWGRVEETIGEDPTLVATIASAYVHGLEGTGVVATLKHFAGYSGSRAGRNHAPVSAGPRELAEIYYPPFELALRDGGARSVMNSYAEVDGVPAAADEARLTGLLRDEWGFEGTVVADYFAVAFLRTLQRVAASDGDAAALALRAGIDVELPSPLAYTGPLGQEVRAGRVPEDLVDRALLRVLTQKAELGLLDPDWEPGDPSEVDLDPPADQELALQIARESVVLLDSGAGVLPLTPGASVAVIGPLADDPFAMLGCYSFPAHVGVHHPEAGLGVEIPSLLSQVRTAHSGTVSYAQGCDVQAPGRDGFERALAVAREADVVVVAVGDRAGLFGRGTSGEGCDAADLSLPGEQAALIEAVLGTGTPVVVVVLSGRPYALGAYAGRAALVQTFFPGERGGRAIAEVLTGAVNPSGHLPVQIPRDPGSQPGTYLAPPLGLRNGVSNLDPTPLFPFGYGRSYAELTWGAVNCEATQWPTDGDVEFSLELANETGREASDVVQLYVHDPVAQVTRPDVRLVGYQRVTLAPGERARVTFTVPADVASFPGLAGHRIVEPGEVELRVARSAADVHHTIELALAGPQRRVGFDRSHVSTAEVVIDVDRGQRTLEEVSPA